MLAENLILNLAWLVLVVIFTVLLIVIAKTLRQTAIFSDRMAFVLAICVSLLSVLGIVRQFGDIGTNGDMIANGDKVRPDSLDFILIPYTAMALAILLVLLLLAIAWIIKAKPASRCRQHIHSNIKGHADNPQKQLSKPSNTDIIASKKEERLHNKLP